MAAITNEELKLAADTIRCLSIDEIQAANSGHPGVALGLADVAAVLWLKYLKVSGKDSTWIDRDRFVLSGGHGSALLYSLLHLSGYQLALEDLKKFRQLGSKTPGHPEFGHTDGVDTTTGPLGQGIAAGVGMAIAEKMLAARFNTEKRTVIDHRTWIFCGDGDMMEGISHEACSMAGNLGLEKLVMFYDSNTISIEGRTSITMCDDTEMRFKSYGWLVLSCDGHDYDSIERAIRKSMRSTDKPVLIVCKTTIGKGSPNKADTAGCHGSPLGAEEVKLTKTALGFDPEKSFFVPEEIREIFARRQSAMARNCSKWRKMLKTELSADSKMATAWESMMNNEIPELKNVIPRWDGPVSTRVASGKILNAIAPHVPQLVGGSADLAPSNMTYMNSLGDIARDSFGGRNFHFGIREQGMAGVMNGIAVHGGFRIFGGTFFVFCDYCRPVIRVAALMKLPVVYVLTHDSFYVGEDGPTHEPVEQLASLRAMPNLTVIRPADASETAVAWEVALNSKESPVALLLSRQNLPVIDRKTYPAAELAAKGAYVLWQKYSGTTPTLTIIASGSEVSLALEAAQRIQANVRVVSMPSWELFEQQDAAYKNSVLDPNCKRRLAVEAASGFGWERYIGDNGIFMGMKGFGASGAASELAKYFGFTVDAVEANAKILLSR